MKTSIIPSSLNVSVSKSTTVVLAQLLLLALLQGPLRAQITAHSSYKESAVAKHSLRIEHDDQNRIITVYRDNEKAPILTENAYDDTRPYIHPIVAPDGKGLITEFRPTHHPHQMGIFWGLKMVNGQDYFMKWQNDHYRKVSARVIEPEGQVVKWQTVYDMLDEKGATVMTETQDWSMQAVDGKYILDLQWQGQAKTHITFGQYYVSGLFVRMPWHAGVRAETVNSNGLRNQAAEAQHAKWVDVGIQEDGRDDPAHIVVFDYPGNDGFPGSWRVDEQFGFGPNRSWREWKMEKDQTETLRYRLIAYTGKFDASKDEDAYKAFVAVK
ncbi:MAG TPA: DUF6807 family protein [Edaphobacter sp.]